MSSSRFTSYVSLFLIQFSSFAIAATPEEIRGLILQQITQRHPAPSSSFWGSLGPEALSVIQQMYTESSSIHEKTWLIDGLSYYNDPSVAKLLQEQISISKNSVMKKKMLGALIQSQGESAYDFVEPYLHDSNPNVRLQVAKSMKKWMSSDRVQARLNNFSQNEPQKWVKEEWARTQVLVIKKPSVLRAQVVPMPTPLPEASWVGMWDGVYVTASKSSAAKLTLSLINANPSALQAKWKVEFKLPKQTSFEWKGKPLDIVYYQTGHLHWLEIRNKADDAVFLGERK